MVHNSMDKFVEVLIKIFIAFTLHGYMSYGFHCENEMAVYNVTFTTFWTDDRFPKQYPYFRPNAQFSPLIGKTNVFFLLFF